MKKLFLFLSAAAVSYAASAQDLGWPRPAAEAKPYTRWWWLGSAVDSANLSYNLQALASKGVGGVEITPLYGVQGNDANNIPFLSPRWMEMLRYTEREGQRLGIEVNMNTGTGWPFGGPHIGVEDAASKVFFQTYTLSAGQPLAEPVAVHNAKQKGVAKLSRLIAFDKKTGQHRDLTAQVDANGGLSWATPAEGEWLLVAVFCGKTQQQVKRAAPGGEGYVFDHFSKAATQAYLKRFDDAFASTQTPYPPVFFNDSYEVYGADWTPTFFDEFARRRGYQLEAHLPAFIAAEGFVDNEKRTRLIDDYRETISELLLENFTQTWTAWAHAHGSQTRNQAHGSPGNLLDLYAAVDMPECESFGISDFDIKGLRRDSLIKPNDSDLSMLKYASSAAHVAGKPLVSSETFTWLTEHFRTSLSQCKPDLDQLFLAGINHVVFHGTPYSPREAAWPGWQFYASVNFSPTNSIWRDADAMFDYISRVQSFMQYGVPDNDFLLYLPLYDIWRNERKSHYMAFSIHDMKERAPQFIEAVNNITSCGFDVDYISDRYIKSTVVDHSGLLKTQSGARYKAIIVPNVTTMPVATLKALEQLARQGATVIFVGQYPSTIPGLQLNGNNQKLLEATLKSLPVGTFTAAAPNKDAAHGKGRIITSASYNVVLRSGFTPEPINRSLRCIRRSNESGHHYFISNLSGHDFDEDISFAVSAKSAVIYNPMNGSYGKASARFRLQLRSGESLIVRTLEHDDVSLHAYPHYAENSFALDIRKGWHIQFRDLWEDTTQMLSPGLLRSLGSWTNKAPTYAGSARYSVQFTLPQISADGWLLDLGDVRESARVRVNGQDVATLWAVPFCVDVSRYVKPGESNTLEVDVTNLPANRIADYDKRGVQWRIFNEINFVDIKYRKTKYGHWSPMPSGLLGPVKLIPVTKL